MIMEILTKENLSKLAYLAVGVVVANEEKIKETINGWIDDGKVAEEDGRRFVDEMIDKSKEARKDLEERVKKISEEWYKAAHIGTTEQIEALEKRVKALESKAK